MKSSIDHAGEPAQPWVPGNREFSAGRAARRERGSLGKGGVYLDQCRFGPEGDTGSSLQGRTLSVGRWPGSSIPPQKRGVQAPTQGEEEFGDSWLALNALCSHPARACCPSRHGPSLCHASPRSLSCRRKLSQGLAEKQQPHEGACSEKNKAPTLEALAASQGTPRSLTTGREGQ